MRKSTFRCLKSYLHRFFGWPCGFGCFSFTVPGVVGCFVSGPGDSWFQAFEDAKMTWWFDVFCCSRAPTIGSHTWIRLFLFQNYPCIDIDHVHDSPFLNLNSGVIVVVYLRSCHAHFKRCLKSLVLPAVMRISKFFSAMAFAGFACVAQDLSWTLQTGTDRN